MHWGHAASADLLHWDYLPCALAPDTAADAAGCFSGSAVPLPDGQLLLLYTGVQPAGIGHKELQAQCVAVGDGRDFAKDAANPVITAAMLPAGYSAVDFRDPKIWQEGGQYYCVAASRHKTEQGSILLFESPDGHTWHYLTVLDASHDALGKMWECPDFFALDGAQVLLVSPQEMRATADGEFHAGEGTVAILGRYDPATTPLPGKACRPSTTASTFTPRRRRWPPTAAASWWPGCKAGPPRPARPAAGGRPWFGRMTLPRELRVQNGRLYQTPVREIETLWHDKVELTGVTVEGDAALPGIGGRKPRPDGARRRCRQPRLPPLYAALCRRRRAVQRDPLRP